MLNYQADFEATKFLIETSSNNQQYDIAKELTKILFKEGTNKLNWIQIILHIPRVVAYILAYVKDNKKNPMRTNNSVWLNLYDKNKKIGEEIETILLKKDKNKIKWRNAIFKIKKIAYLTENHLHNRKTMAVI